VKSIPSRGVCPSFCLSVCHEYMNKYILRPTILVFFKPNVMTIFRRGPANGALNAGGVGKNRDSRRISGYRIDDWRSGNNNCDGPPCIYSLPQRPPRRHASVSFCLSQPAWTTTTKRREKNRIYLYAAVNLKRK